MVWKQNLDGITVDFEAEVIENIPGISKECVEANCLVNIIINKYPKWTYMLPVNWFRVFGHMWPLDSNDVVFDKKTFEALKTWKLLMWILWHNDSEKKEKMLIFCKKKN